MLLWFSCANINAHVLGAAGEHHARRPFACAIALQILFWLRRNSNLPRRSAIRRRRTEARNQRAKPKSLPAIGEGRKGGATPSKHPGSLRSRTPICMPGALPRRPSGLKTYKKKGHLSEKTARSGASLRCLFISVRTGQCAACVPRRRKSLPLSLFLLRPTTTAVCLPARPISRTTS